MNVSTKIVFVALGATFFVAGCKTGEENPATPDLLRKMNSDRSNFKPGANGVPSGATQATGSK